MALFGTEITVLALPLMAALMLGATPLQMGLLVAAGRGAVPALQPPPRRACSTACAGVPSWSRPIWGGRCCWRWFRLPPWLGVLRIELLYVGRVSAPGC